ncbi:MAG: hypoxanthine phosphoribosyltransferase [Calditrichaeota bacterium]|nr:hypoxanthine phosphoribosyltransferase [Calditrichota bacterium]MCB9366335.1 hypoxanthine phosphoribosyltransferase [Calditrichota bacterium]
MHEYSEHLVLGQPPRKFERYLTSAEIQRAVKETGLRINERFAGEEPVFVGVLTGCFMYMADIVRASYLSCTIDFIKLSSYGDGMESGRVRLIKDIDCDIRDRHVIVVDDIVDTGNSWDFLKRFLMVRNPKSLSMAACFRKPKSVQTGVEVDFISIDLPDEFVIGYGLDYAGQGRHLPDLYILSGEETK